MTARPRDIAKPAPKPEPVRVTVRWPGGPYDFVLLNPTIEDAWLRTCNGHDGWVYVTGELVEPYHDYRTLYARPTGDREYEMLPKRD